MATVQQLPHSCLEYDLLEAATRQTDLSCASAIANLADFLIDLGESTNSRPDSLGRAGAAVRAGQTLGPQAVSSLYRESPNFKRYIGEIRDELSDVIGVRPATGDMSINSYRSVRKGVIPHRDYARVEDTGRLIANISVAGTRQVALWVAPPDLTIERIPAADASRDRCLERSPACLGGEFVEVTPTTVLDQEPPNALFIDERRVNGERNDETLGRIAVFHSAFARDPALSLIVRPRQTSARLPAYY